MAKRTIQRFDAIADPSTCEHLLREAEEERQKKRKKIYDAVRDSLGTSFSDSASANRSHTRILA